MTTSQGQDHVTLALLGAGFVADFYMQALASVPHQKVVYDGAPHSFFDRRFEQHKAASADAWQQMLAFIAEHTRQPART